MVREELEKVWEKHTTAEFLKRDLEATMATMVDEPYIKIIPINVGGSGKDGVRAFYSDVMIPSIPDDLQARIINRIIGDRHLVDEIYFTFTHNKQMDWFLPGIPSTNKRIELEHVVVVEFRGDKIAGERVYWDHATVLRQVGLLKD
ncbi:MAG: ester cyclase [Deltaproteobacteria bacterium]|nr:ester cyclase [Deltaproteobacteria bacterium]